MRDFLYTLATIDIIAGFTGLTWFAEAQTPLSTEGALMVMVVCFIGWFFLWENYVVRGEKEAVESDHEALRRDAFDLLERLPSSELLKLKVMAGRLFSGSATEALDRILLNRSDLDNGGNQED